MFECFCRGPGYGSFLAPREDADAWLMEGLASHLAGKCYIAALMGNDELRYRRSREAEAVIDADDGDTLVGHTQVDPRLTAFGFCASSHNMMNRFQTLISTSTCATTHCRRWRRRRHGCGVAVATPGRAVQVDPIKPKLKPPGTNGLKRKCDILLSTSAFTFNLRRYIRGHECGGGQSHGDCCRVRGRRPGRGRGRRLGTLVGFFDLGFATAGAKVAGAAAAGAGDGGPAAVEGGGGAYPKPYTLYPIPYTLYPIP
jgi:hypothetical protein